MKHQSNNSIRLPGPVSFFMRIVLKLRRNPDKINRLLVEAGVKENMKILDYGCGIGSYTIEAARIVGNSGKVTACDIDKNMLKEVVNLKKKERMNGNIITILLIKSLKDVKDSDFNFVFLIDVLHLIRDKPHLIHSLLEKLTRQGKLIIKFEHISNKKVKKILSDIDCFDYKLLCKKYWLLKG